eukprot:Awhi_evm1s8898
MTLIKGSFDSSALNLLTEKWLKDEHFKRKEFEDVNLNLLYINRKKCHLGVFLEGVTLAMMIIWITSLSQRMFFI